MKKTQKILGLPIISISDGLEVGKVKSIIINADRGAIDYIVVDSGIQIFSARIIPTEDVLGIGEYALTIENESVITDISKIPAAIQLLQNDIRVKGTKVLTKKGSLIGEIGDIYIDENNECKITGLEFIADITQKKIRLIPRDTVITFGKNLTVVKEDFENSLLDTPSQLGSDPVYSDFSKKNSANTDGFDFADVSAASDTAAVETVYAEAEPVRQAAAETVSHESDSASVLFEQRQRQYLKGRYATRTISDNMGNVIVGEGMEITDAVIDDAKSRGKLIELVMNNRA
ncbi:MAG: PRC-barrel domain-containing protein [Clostridiaceae bacterium]